MSDPQSLVAAIGDDESLSQHLALIDVALGDGDISEARRQLRMLRRWLGVGEQADDLATMSGGVALTGQEIASLRLLPDGSLSQKDIARAMGVTRNTLKTHLKSMYLKLGVHCRAEAIVRAREIGLLPRPLTLVPQLPDDGDAATVDA